MSDMENVANLLDRLIEADSRIERILADMNEALNKQQAAIAGIGLRVAELERVVGTKKTYNIEEACRVIGISRSLAYKKPNLLPRPITRDPLRYSIEEVQQLAKRRAS